MPTTPAWILSLVVHYVLAQIAKLGTSVDWNKLAEGAVSSVLVVVDQFMPKWLQNFVNPGITAVVTGAIGAIAAACTDTADLQGIVDALQAGNWNLALTTLEALLSKVVHPSAAAVQAVCPTCHITGAAGLLPSSDV